MNPIQIAAVTPAHGAAAAAHASAAPLIRTTMVPNLAPPVQTVQSSPTPPPPETWAQLHASWATHSLAGLFVIAAIALIFLLAIQTTKQEGLSGSIGGRVESNYRGRLGADEQLKRITGWAATVFVFTALILSLTGI